MASDAPSEYARLTRRAERLSVDFCLRTGRSDLDNKAVVGLDRVVNLMADLHASGDRILLIGFADSTGSRQMNIDLSQNRAATVQREFKLRGLDPQK